MIPRDGRPEIVLIGPVCAGKSTVGDLLGEALATEHVDVDHVATRYYLEAEWSVERFRAIERQAGLLEAYRDGEAAMVSVLERALADYHDCVFSLGAAHTHFVTPALMDRARQTVMSFAHVVLLLPSPDPARSVSILRERCFALGLPSWRDAGCDLIERWVIDSCNRDLATLTVYTEGRNAEHTKDEVLSALAF
jgi:shikimate kinase